MATQPFLAELRAFSFSYAPKGWAACNGQLLPVNSNQALFSIIGAAFGGDGRTTFGLPNLQGRVPVGTGTSSGDTYAFGQAAGSASVALNSTQVPAHTHSAAGSTGLSSNAPGSGVLPGTFDSTPAYAVTTTGLTAMSGSAVVSIGGGQAHENRQPSLPLTICIALQGVYPSRS